MNQTLQYIITGAAVAMFAGIAWAQFKKGTRTESGDIIKFYKEEAASYKDIIEKKDARHTEEIKKLTADFNGQMHTLSEKFGILQGKYDAEKEAREKAEEILKDKNPETIGFMQFMIKATENQDMVNKEIIGMISDVHKMVKEEHDRETHIEATIKKA